MTRAMTGAFITELGKTSTNLVRLYEIVRTDDITHYFCTHDADVDFGGNTYEAIAGVEMGAVETSSTMAVDNSTLQAFFNSPNGATENEIRAGRFDGAEVFIRVVIPSNIGAGDIKLHRGKIGLVKMTDRGIFEAEYRGFIEGYRNTIAETYGPICKDNVGGPRCRIPIFPPVVAAETAYDLTADPNAMNPLEDGQGLNPNFVLDDIGGTDGIPNYQDRIFEVTVAGTTDGETSRPIFDTTVGNTTVWGGVTFTAREGWLRAITVDAVDTAEPSRIFTVSELTPVSGGTTPGRDYFPDDSLNGGGVLWTSGLNDGTVIEIKDFIGDIATVPEQTIELWDGMPFVVAPGDTALVWRGCVGTMAVCNTIFGNHVNARLEKWIPGQDFLMRTPDARF